MSVATYKILFLGASGAGKTTAIGSISNTPPIRTEVANNDPSLSKALTTVGLDYGEVTAPGQGDQLMLYGCPGQQRYEFMWEILARGSLGVVILCDNQSADPLGELRHYLDVLQRYLEGDVAVVIGVVKMDLSPTPELERYAEVLEAQGLAFPVMGVDVRQRDEVLLLLEAVVCQVEARALLEGAH